LSAIEQAAHARPYHAIGKDAVGILGSLHGFDQRSIECVFIGMRVGWHIEALAEQGDLLVPHAHLEHRAVRDDDGGFVISALRLAARDSSSF
jgi:hypothetical protein